MGFRVCLFEAACFCESALYGCPAEEGICVEVAEHKADYFFAGCGLVAWGEVLTVVLGSDVEGSGGEGCKGDEVVF